MTKLFSFIFFLTVLFSLPASAQTDPLNIESFEKITQMITKEAAQEAIKLALANITAAQCNDGKSCSAATKEEYDNPPISESSARAAMAYGVYGALARWCDLNSNRAFIPMFRTARDQAKMNPRQLYLMSFIYGDFMRRQFDFYKAKGSCPPTFKERIDATLPKIKE